MRVAKALGGTVINADSMQVYSDLHVLTARPFPEDEEGIPHRLYGHVDGAVNYSVGRYVADAIRALKDLQCEGRVPVFVGGTGLYFKALTEGLSEIPPVPDAVRERVRRESEGVATPDLHRRLADRDPAAARALHPSDRLRVQRALEVLAATRRSILSFQGERQPGALDGVPLVKLFLAPEREELRRRIDVRFLAMMENGALEEVRGLAARGLDPMLPVMRAHGVPGLLAHLRGEITLDEAIAKGQADTRAYSKRQFTWFRHQLGGWTWAAPEEAWAAFERSLAETLL